MLFINCFKGLKMKYKHPKLKQCFLRKTMSPQPSSFVGYIENYGIAVSLKIKSRSPKSNQLKICSLVQKIKSGNEIWHFKKGPCDLEN